MFKQCFQATHTRCNTRAAAGEKELKLARTYPQRGEVYIHQTFSWRIVRHLLACFSRAAILAYTPTEFSHRGCIRDAVYHRLAISNYPFVPLFFRTQQESAPLFFSFAPVCVGGVDMRLSVHNEITEDAAHRKARGTTSPERIGSFCERLREGSRVNRFMRTHES